MKNNLLILLLALSFVILFENAHADAEFVKDQGDGLTPEECQKRYDMFGSHFEPILDLAKLKAESHPVFKQLTQDTSYKLISTGVRSSNFSENCNTDLPSFQLHYALGDTSGPYTRIYMVLDNVSYDVHEIRTNLIDSPWTGMPKSEKLPFYITNWDMVHMLGEYPNSEPQRPSQVFKIPYIANNGKVNHIETHPGTIKADVSINDGGIFALKIPRNYPYTDHDDSVHPGHGFEPFAIEHDPVGEVFAHVTKTDCYYDVWMHVSGNRTVELGTTFSYLQGDPMHGDSDVPEFCLIKTIADDDTEYLTELSPHKQVEEGMSPYLVFCRDGLFLILKNDGSSACVSANTQSSLWHRDWADKSTDIYKKYATPQILDEFHSRLLSEKDALKTVEEFIDKTGLVLVADSSDPDFLITSNLEYDTLQRQSVFRIDYQTGLPFKTASPEQEGFYRTPNWYAELQRDYLGMSSQRIEDGNVAWEVSYRVCSMCHDYASFYVDAITGDVLDTRNIDEMFAVFEKTTSPAPSHMSESALQLHDAKKSLELAYYENINLGPLKINDVVVGFGTEDSVLVIDVKYRYSTSSEMDIVKKKIRDVVGEEIQIEYVPFKPSVGTIEMAMPYYWNEYLHKNNIEFEPANTLYGNDDGGIGDGTILCSSLIAPNGTEFYIASTVDVEPFVITDTFIEKIKPDFCRKHWKTDVLLEEPNRIISLWLAMGQEKIPLE